MTHDLLNKSRSVPELPSSSHAWETPSADMLYGDDHPIDPLANELKREEWLSHEIDSNPLAAGADDLEAIHKETRDERETRYGAKLVSLTVSLNEGEESGEDSELDPTESDDEEAAA